jgi:hypothetical protein
MKKRLFYLLTIMIILVGGCSSNVSKSNDNNQHESKSQGKIEKFKVKSFNSLPNKEITLLEAYRLGEKLANKYSKNSELVTLGSVEDGLATGADGKKGNWQGVFYLPNINRKMLFDIQKGKLKSYTLFDNLPEPVIKKSEIKIDSDRIVRLAQKEFNLKPGEKSDPFSRGYHFRLIRDEKNTFLGVSGKIGSKNAEIFYNPFNGKYYGRTQEK